MIFPILNWSKLLIIEKKAKHEKIFWNLFYQASNNINVRLYWRLKYRAAKSVKRDLRIKKIRKIKTSIFWWLILTVYHKEIQSKTCSFEAKIHSKWMEEKVPENCMTKKGVVQPVIYLHCFGMFFLVFISKTIDWMKQVVTIHIFFLISKYLKLQYDNNDSTKNSH